MELFDKRTFKKELCNSLFFVVVWSLWFERNRVKFQNKQPNPALFEVLKRRLGEWIRIYTPKFPYTTWKITDNLQAGSMELAKKEMKENNQLSSSTLVSLSYSTHCVRKSKSYTIGRKPPRYNMQSYSVEEHKIWLQLSC